MADELVTLSEASWLMIKKNNRNLLPSLLKPQPFVPAASLMVCRRSTPASSSGDAPEPEPEQPPLQLLAWKRVVRRLLRLARVRRLWAALGHWLRIVKLRGAEEFRSA